MSHVSKMTFSLYIAALMLSALACGATLPENNVADGNPTSQVVVSAPNQIEPEMIVRVDEALNIRDGADGNETGNYLIDGDTVVVSSRVTVRGTEWCAIEPMYTRWVACRYLKGK